MFHQPPLIAPTYKRSVDPSVIRNKAQNVDKYTFANYDAEHTHPSQRSKCEWVCDEDNIRKILCLEMLIILFGGAYSLAKLSFEC